MKNNQPSINQINAGLIFTHARMLGLNLEETLVHAQRDTLEVDFKDRIPHRATVVRLVRKMWLSAERRADEEKKHRARFDAYDVMVMMAYPQEWNDACALDGADRREAKRLIRRKYDHMKMHQHNQQKDQDDE